MFVIPRCNICLSLLVLSALTTLARADDTTIVVASPGQQIRVMLPDWLGANAEITRGPSYEEADFLEAIAKVAPSRLRYPGGTIANYWDWETGWLIPGTDPPYGLDKAKPNPRKLEDLRHALEAAHSQPVFVLNLMTSTLDHQLAMLEHAEGMGLPIDRIELGNEFYLDRTHYVELFPTAEDYAEVANRWIAAIKQRFPEAQVAAVGAYVRSGDEYRRKTWNERVLAKLQGADALVLHIYHGAGLGTEVNKLLEAQGLVDSRQKGNGMVSDLPVQRLQRQAMETPGGMATVLGTPWTGLKTIKDLASVPDGMKVWITEFNLFDRTGPLQNTWAHGLFLAGYISGLLQHPEISLATVHNLTGNTAFALIFREENSFAKHLDGPPNQRLTLTALGEAYRPLSLAMRGHEKAQRIAFSPCPMVKMKDNAEYGADTYPALQGWVFTGGGEPAVAFVLNLSETPRTIDPSTLGLGVATFSHVWANPLNYVTGPGDMERDQGPLGETLTLQAYSITLLSGQTQGGRGANY